MPPPTRISIALCTFNGEQFLGDQLHSLTRQTKQPDELIASDDGSTDDTIQILERFVSSASFPVQILRNEQQFGPAQNFARAIAACTGDIISCCDQDDVWQPQKLEKTAAAFGRDPSLAFCFSDAQICDMNCNPLGYRLWSSVGFSRQLQLAFHSGNGFDVLLRQNVVTGATLSFAARYRPLILPIPAGWMHDGWIALLLAAVGHGTAIDQPLIRYRQHAAQSVGAARRSLYQQYLNARAMGKNVFGTAADQYEAALTRLQEQTDFDLPHRVIDQLQKKIAHLRRRSAIRHREIPRIAPAFTELITRRYSRFSLGWKSFAQDLFL